LITLATAQTVINHSWPTAVTDAGLQLAVVLLKRDEVALVWAR